MTIKKKEKKTPRPFTRAESFFIQLATVIVGIIITFGGSSLIQKHAERKDVCELLAMVKKEIEHNIGTIEKQKENLYEELRAANALKPYTYHPENVPTDTINKYLAMLSGEINLPIHSNSLEILKSAPEIETVKNKELLRNIFQLYETMLIDLNDIQVFHRTKVTGMREYIESMSLETEKKFFDDEAKNQYKNIFIHLMNNAPNTRLYIRWASDGGWLATNLLLREDSAIVEAKKVVTMIDKEIGL